MKIKIVGFLILMLIIHLSAVITSCCPGRCDDPIVIFAKVEKAVVSIYSNFHGQQEPFDRRTLGLSIVLAYPDSLEEDLYYRQSAGLITDAFATSPCRDYPEIILTERITQIEILVVNELDESTQDISTDFLAVVEWDVLYREIPEVLSKEDRYEIALVYQQIPVGDSQKWIVNTTLSDNRVMRDTLNFSLQ